MDAVYEFRDAAGRRRRIREITGLLFDEHGDDPFTNPESAAAMRQLARYRAAAAEMSLHRAIDTLRAVQPIRLGRIVHLAKSENETIGLLASPNVFAFSVADGMGMNRVARENFDDYHGAAKPSGRCEFAKTKPIAATANPFMSNSIAGNSHSICDNG